MYYDAGPPKKINPAAMAVKIAAGLLIGFALGRIFFTPYVVHHNFMIPTYPPGTRILVFKYGTPKQGDAVLVESPREEGRYFLLRVIGRPEERIEIRNQKIYLQSREFTPSWKTTHTDRRTLPQYLTYRDSMPALLLGRDEYFLIGDNLDSSYDSRTFGPVKKDTIKGRVALAW